MGASSGSIWVSLGLRTANFQKGINQAKGQLTGFQRGMAGLKGMFNPLTVGLGAVASLGAAFADATRIAIEFEKANSKLEAILKATDLQMKLLSDNAKQLGASTQFTASEVTGLQTEFAKLGFPTRDILNMTKATLDGASALGAELAPQAALVGAIMKQYGLDAREAGRVNDVLALSASSSALDFEKLATAMPIVGATAATAGVSLERTAALLGTLSDRGLDASSSGTALRNVFLELSKQGLTYEQAMAKINTATDKNAVALELFGKRGATAGVILAESGVSLEKFTLELQNANGAAKIMAQTMLDNVAGDVTKAKSAWEGFVLSLEDGSGVLSQLARTATETGTTYLQMLTAMNGDNSLNEISNLWGKHIGIIDETAKTYKTASGNIVLSQEEMIKASQNSEAAVLELKKRFNEGSITAARFQQGIEMLAGGFKVLTAAEKEANAKAKSETALNEKLQKETEKLKAAEKTAGEYAAAMKKADAEFVKMLKKLEKAEGAFKEMDNLDFSNLKIDKNAGDELAELLGDLEFEVNVIPEMDIDPAMAKLKAKNEALRNLGEGMANLVRDGFGAAAAEAFSSVGTAIGTAMAGGDMGNIGKEFLGALAGIIGGIGKQMIAMGIAALLAKKALKGLFANPALAIGAGVALIAVGAAMTSMLSQDATPTGFANGGLVTGATMGIVGEGRGTTMSNPEVIAPLDKLKNIIGDTGGGGGNVTFRIEGNTLVGIMDRMNKNTKYSS